MSYNRWEQNRQAYQANMGSMDFRDDTGGIIDYQMEYPQHTSPNPTNVIAQQAAPAPMPVAPVMPVEPVMPVVPVTVIAPQAKTAGIGGTIPTIVWLALGGVALYYANQQGWLNKKLV